MSLFSSRVWWETKPERAEEFDGNGFCVGNVDNDITGADKIVTGSLNGYIRVYHVHSAGFQIDDLMLEQNLELPILQVLCGKFIQNSPQRIALAVLHPRKLVVYTLMAMNVGGNSVGYHELVKNYEHKLERSAFNMCSGAFGGVYGRDYICVQSLDCQLSFFEQESFAFTRSLPNSLIPSPIIYYSKIDSFIVQNSCFEIECYKYQVISASTSAVLSEDEEVKGSSTTGDVLGTTVSNSSLNSSNAPGKKMQVDWSVSLGEIALDIQIARFSRSLAASQMDILVLGEHTLFTVKEGGSIRLQKRLDYNPACCVAFTPDISENGRSNEQQNQHLLVSSHEEFLMLYRDTQLIWASKFNDSVPVALKVTTFAGVKGLICGMTDSGHIMISYLGTDPPTSSASENKENKVVAKELDYDAMEDEHKKLLKLIREAAANATAEPSEKIILDCSIQQNLESKFEQEGLEPIPGANKFSGSEYCAKDEQGREISLLLRINVGYNGFDIIDEATLSMKIPDGFVVESQNFKLDSSGKTVSLKIKPSKVLLPSSRQVLVICSYITKTGEPRTSQCSIDLPFLLVGKAVQPRKNAAVMYTIDTNRAPVPLIELFDDVVKQGIPNFSEIQRLLANTLMIEYFAQSVSYSPLPVDIPADKNENSIVPTISAPNEPNKYTTAINQILAENIPVVTKSLFSQDCSILVSKKGGRYRLQGSNLESMWMLTSVLVTRLSSYFATHETEEKDAFNVSFAEELPFQAYFECIDDHFRARQFVEAWNLKIEELAHQFRAIQKRLLARFKDRNPSPLTKMDFLLTETYESLMLAGNHLDICQQKLQIASNKLSSATSVMLLLIKLKFDLDDANFEIIQSYISPNIIDSTELSWEDTVDASISYCLKMATAAKNSQSTAASVTKSKDTSKLKKHFQMFVDRLSKGLRFANSK